ncbi:MAG: Gfo/Idh/MocA family oxidoreductase [Cyanobacteriota bacterium]|nr:Gfo/Idh/MocA family oxidoreductase [Cyanobacteriota bacterium]
MTLRLAIAGLGAAARQIHLPAYAKVAGLEVVGGYDPVPPAWKPSFPCFDSLDALLVRTRPDILAVVAPPAHHHELTSRGLEAGCHVFCEKPFMATLEEADHIVALSRAQKRWVVVNNQYRFMGIHSGARKLIGQPGFGELLFLHASQTFHDGLSGGGAWRGRDTRRTCHEFGIHVLDLCRFFFDSEPLTIDARMPNRNHQDGPDHLDLLRLEFPGDRVAQVTLDRLSHGPHRYLDIRLDGSEGCIESQIGGNIVFSTGVRGGSRRPFANLDVTLGGKATLWSGGKARRIGADPLDIFANATAELLRAFLDALQRGTTPPCHGEDNRRSLALVMAAYASAQARQPVTLMNR